LRNPLVDVLGDLRDTALYSFQLSLFGIFVHSQRPLPSRMKDAAIDKLRLSILSGLIDPGSSVIRLGILLQKALDDEVGHLDRVVQVEQRHV
jgi:hypothetical protein